MASCWLDPYIVGHYRLEVANDVFNGVRHALFCRAATLPSVSSVALCYRVALHCSSVRRVVSSAGALL
jgi:hypothetical protein